MVGPAAKREAVAHLRAMVGLSERRACSIINADRKMVPCRSCRPRSRQRLPASNSFFSDRGRVLAAWSGPGALFVVTHQMNIIAVTGIFPASGEGTVLERRGTEWAVAGRIRP